MDGLKLIITSFQNYTWGNRIWFLYPVALVLIAVLGDKKARRIFLYPLLLALVTVFQPVVAAFLAEKFGFTSRYLRLFWTLQYYFVIGYAGVLVVFRLKKRWARAVAIGLCAVAIVLTGSPVFTGEEAPAYVGAVNDSFTENEYIQLSAMIHSDHFQKPLVCFPEHVLLTYRMYDPDVISVISRPRYRKLQKAPDLETFRAKRNFRKNLKIVLRVYWYNDTSVPYDTFVAAAKKRNISYFVIFQGSELNEYFEAAGLVYKGETATYRVWATPYE